jgi:hypothetical protein
MGLGPLDNSLARVLGNISQQASAAPRTSLETLADWLSTNLPEDTAQNVANLLATPITTNKTNIASGKPVTIGQVGIDGKRSYDTADDVVPGTTLPLTKALDFLGITKRSHCLA